MARHARDAFRPLGCQNGQNQKEKKGMFVELTNTRLG